MIPYTPNKAEVIYSIEPIQFKFILSMLLTDGIASGRRFTDYVGWFIDSFTGPVELSQAIFIEFFHGTKHFDLMKLCRRKINW